MKFSLKLNFANHNPEDEYSLSLSKRTVLLNQLLITMQFVLLAYWIIVHFTSLVSVPLAFPILWISSLVILVINNLGYFKWAAAAGLLIFNAMIFIAMSSEPYETAVHLYLINAGFMSLIFFTREDKIIGFIFVGLSCTLYFLGAFFNFSIVEFRHFSKDSIKLSFFINSFIYTSVCFYFFYLIMRLNQKAKHNLKINQQEITDQYDKLKKINQELDRFVYSASHDLRAPLSSISGLISLAESDKEGVDEYLPMIKDRIGVMDRFIREIIDYSRNARLEVASESINIKAFIEEIVEMLKFSSGNEKVNIQIDIPSTLFIQSDKSRLSVVFNNLVSNAIKYHDSKKQNPSVIISATTKGNVCVIQLSDNGIGIKAEHLPKIFEMFYRATERSKGSGLGLYIVKETLDKLKGEISVRSEYGQGTTFTVSLPL